MCVERMDVSVETAVCHTLLGDLDAALAALRLTHGSAAAPDSGVVEFVSQATGGEGGPEAGACVLVERWVRTVLTEEVPEFYKGRTFTLEYWGSLPEVGPRYASCVHGDAAVHLYEIGSGCGVLGGILVRRRAGDRAQASGGVGQCQRWSWERSVPYRGQLCSRNTVVQVVWEIAAPGSVGEGRRGASRCGLRDGRVHCHLVDRPPTAEYAWTQTVVARRGRLPLSSFVAAVWNCLAARQQWTRHRADAVQVQQYLDEREEEMQAAPPVRAVRALVAGVAATARRALAALLVLFGFATMAASLDEGRVHGGVQVRTTPRRDLTAAVQRSCRAGRGGGRRAACVGAEVSAVRCRERRVRRPARNAVLAVPPGACCVLWRGRGRLCSASWRCSPPRRTTRGRRPYRPR